MSIDAFGRTDPIVAYDHAPAFEAARAGGVEDETDRMVREVRFAPGDRARLFAEATPKPRPDDADRAIIDALGRAPLPLGYISQTLVYSDGIVHLPHRVRGRIYRLVKGRHLRVVMTRRPTPQYWLMRA